MTVKIKPTDRRHTGHSSFAWMAEPAYVGIGRRSERILKFIEIREWCWATFGASCERDHWLELKKFNQPVPNDRWTWHTDFGNFKIYLCTEKEANWFKLKWL